MPEIPYWFKAEPDSLQYQVLYGVNEVKKYLDDHPESLNNQDSQSYSALHYASMFGKLDIVEFLVEKGADIHLNGMSGQDALHLACMFGNLEVVKFLFDKGAEINKPDNDGNFPIHGASVFDRSEIVEFLVSKGNDPNCKNKNLLSPLALALLIESTNDNKRERENTLNTLTRLGADLNLKIFLGSDIYFFGIFNTGDPKFILDFFIDDPKITKREELLKYFQTNNKSQPKTLIDFCLSKRMPIECPQDFLQLMIFLVNKGSKVKANPEDIILSCSDALKINDGERSELFKNFFNVVVGSYLEDKNEDEKLQYKRDLFLKLPKDAKTMKMAMVYYGVLDGSKNLTKAFKDKTKGILRDILVDLNSSKQLKSFEIKFLKKVMTSGVYSREELEKYKKLSSVLFSEEPVDKAVAIDIRVVDNMLSIEDERVKEFDEKIRELKQNNLSISEQEQSLKSVIERERRALGKNPSLQSSIDANLIKLEKLQKKSGSIKTSLKTIEEKYQAIKDELAKNSNVDIVAKENDDFKIDKASFHSYLKNFTATTYKDSTVVFNCTSTDISEDEKLKISGVLSEFYELGNEKTVIDKGKFFKNPAFTTKFKSFIQEKFKPQIKTTKKEEFDSKFLELGALIHSTNDIIYDKVMKGDKPKAFDMQTCQPETVGASTNQPEANIQDQPQLNSKERRTLQRALRAAEAEKQKAMEITPVSAPEVRVEAPEEPAITPAPLVKINYNSTEIANLRNLFVIEASDEQLRLHSKGDSLSKYEDFLVNLSEKDLPPSTDLQDKNINELKDIFHQKLDQELIGNILPEGSNPADKRKLRSYLYGVIAYNIGGEEGREQFIRNYLELQRTSFEKGEFTGFAHASRADKTTLLQMINVVDKLLEVNSNYQEEVRQLKDLKEEKLEEKTVPSHPLRIDNFHRQLLFKMPELRKQIKSDKEYLSDLLLYYRDYDQASSYHSSSENSIKQRFDDLKQEFKVLTVSALDYAVNRGDESATLAQEFSIIFGLSTKQDFKTLQEKFKKGGDEIFDDKKISDYFLNFLKDEKFIELSRPQGAKTRSRLDEFKEFSKEHFRSLEHEYRQREEVKSSGGARAL